MCTLDKLSSEQPTFPGEVGVFIITKENCLYGKKDHDIHLSSIRALWH